MGCEFFFRVSILNSNLLEDQDGLGDGIEKKQVRSFHFSIHGPAKESELASETILESYTLRYQYGSSSAVQLLGSHGGSPEEKTLADFKGDVATALFNVREQLLTERASLPDLPGMSSSSCLSIYTYSRTDGYSVRASVKYVADGIRNYQLPNFHTGSTQEVRRIIRRTENDSIYDATSQVHRYVVKSKSVLSTNICLSFGVGWSSTQDAAMVVVSEPPQSPAPTQQNVIHSPVFENIVKSATYTQKMLAGTVRIVHHSNDRLLTSP